MSKLFLFLNELISRFTSLLFTVKKIISDLKEAKMYFFLILKKYFIRIDQAKIDQYTKNPLFSLIIETKSFCQ